jgi:hypothetical protein
MLLEELYSHYGSWTKLVRDLGLGTSTYAIWRKRGFIPYKSQVFIELKTNGLFKASEDDAKPISI